jgi:sec-independent protein translocase protein TatA
MFPQLGLLEMLIVMGVAVLLFGKRLPEVGRSLGRGIVEFKKGLNGVADELNDNSSSSGISNYSSNHGSTRRYEEKPHGEAVYSDSSVPKFELPGTASSTVSQTEPPRQPPQE